VVATPIGNLEDLSPRAKSVLSEAGLILAEDTRHFGNLASRFGITAKVRSYHDHNEERAAEQAIEILQGGTDVALVSDAGTPTINDPGYRLINRCHQAGVTVRTIPGPSAFVAALSISGFETHRFQFEGYVPPKGEKRKSYLWGMIDYDCTAVAYETPHRIIATLEELALLSPGHEICLARELTKVHEEVLRGPVEDILSVLKSRDQVKGELVLLLRGRPYFEKTA
jgi:16S rRNA (cytidine1402-2'-O)-methyltransferase